MSERILIADDSVSVREAAQSALESRGARLEAVPDGSLALERVRAAAPDLLIADVHMPGLDGYTLCREAKGVSASIRVLLVVGTFEPFDSTAAAAARADAVVRKPFLAAELLRKVEDLLGRPAPPELAPMPARRESEPEPMPMTAAATSPEIAPAVASPEPSAASPEPSGAPAALSDADVDRIARRVLALGGEAVLDRVARELLGEAAFERVRRSAAGAGDRGGDPERG